MPFDPRIMIDVMYPAATFAYLMMTVHAPRLTTYLAGLQKLLP